jgi:hypothetical protein
MSTLTNLYSLFEKQTEISDPKWGIVKCDKIFNKGSMCILFLLIQTKDSVVKDWIHRVYTRFTGISGCDSSDDNIKAHSGINVWEYNNYPWWKDIVDRCGGFEFREILLRHVALDTTLTEEEALYFNHYHLCQEFKKRHNIDELGDKFSSVLFMFKVLIIHTVNEYLTSVGCQKYRFLGNDTENYLEGINVRPISENESHKDIIKSNHKYQQLMSQLTYSFPILKEKIELYLNDKQKVLNSH